MFLVKYFKLMFAPSKILKENKDHILKYLLYFFLLVILALFPFNLQIIRGGGFKLGLMQGVVDDTSFSTNIPIYTYPNYKLSILGLTDLNNETINDNTKYTIELSPDFILVINGEQSDISETTNSIVLGKTKMYYSNNKGKTPMEVPYDFLRDRYFLFDSINTAQNQEKLEVYKILSSYLDSSVSLLNIISTIFIYSSVQILMFIVIVLLLSLLCQLYRIKYPNFMNYITTIKVIILCMGLPCLLGLIVGLFNYALTPVIVQFGIGVYLLFVLVKYAAKNFS